MAIEKLEIPARKDIEKLKKIDELYKKSEYNK